jgi:hypothetical protein
MASSQVRRRREPPNQRVLGHCRSCPADVRWSIMVGSGKRNPLDVEELSWEAILDPSRGVKPGIIAFSTGSGNAQPVTNENLDQVAGWHARGVVTLHVSHFATCPARDQHRKR